MSFLDPCLQMPKCHGFDIEELSITQLQAHLKNRSFSCRELTRCYLERIELLNPRIRAVIEINPDTLGIAERLDSERRDGVLRSNIHGIPFLVKDNINTADDMQTTAGCAALLRNKVTEDAEIVKRLRIAGGVLLGKANLSEWASIRASYYSEAYSSRGGQNRSPYNLAEHPGGSSSGSASALAANMCAFSIGTETDGSVMFPADRNAVVGIKTSVGLLPTDGIIPEAPSMDAVGIFGRSVADAVIVLDVLSQPTFKGVPSEAQSEQDARQHRTSAQPLYSPFLAQKDTLQGARFGLPHDRVWNSTRSNPRHRTACSLLDETVERIKEAGALVVDVEFPSAKEIISPRGWDWTYSEGRSGSELSEFEIVKIEFYHSLAQYLGRSSEGPVRSLEDVVEYNIEHTDTEGGVAGTHPAWPTGQDTLENCVQRKNYDEVAYDRARNYISRKSRAEGIDAALTTPSGKLDALLVPLQADDGVACSVAAKAGYPMITIPVGTSDDGVPFGIGLMQSAKQEGTLIRYASAIEAITRARSRPKFLNWDADNYPYIGSPPL